MRFLRPVVPMVLALAAACGGGDGGSGPNGGLTMSVANPSGDGQSGPPGTVLAPFRVLLANNGSPASGIVVNWSVTAGGGTLNVPTSVTDATGIATAVLTLGPQAGVNQVRATAAGASGSPVTFIATAIVPGAFAQVEVLNNEFDPAQVTINAGGTVAFVWPSGSQQHNIVPVSPNTRPSQPTVRDGPFTHEETFPTAGEYRYFCSVHGTANSGMAGRVVVQ